jgi:tape measure domain-containing protein
MATTTEELRVILTAQDQASQVLKNFGNESSAVANAVKGMWAGVGIAITQQLQQAFAAATDAIIGFNASLEQSRVAWETMLGGAGQAEAMLQQLQQFAATTPFEFPDVERAARRLTAMGFAAKDIIPMLTSIGNTASALGVGTEGVDRITLALGQMSTRTKVTAEDMLQLTEVGVPAWRILAQATGMSIAQVQDAASKGVIPAQTFIKAFQDFAQANYGGLMDRQSRTFSGAVSNIKDSSRILLSGAFEPLFNGLRDLALVFSNFLASDGVRNFANAFRNGLVAIGVFLQVVAQSPPLLIIFQSALIGVASVFAIQMVQSAAAATAAVIRFIAAIVIANAPLALLAAAIAAVALIVISNWDGILQGTEEFRSVLLQGLKDLGKALIDLFATVWDGLTQLVAGALNAIGELWTSFWNAGIGPTGQEGFDSMNEQAADGWTQFVELATRAFEAVLTGWNALIGFLQGLRAAGVPLVGLWGAIADQTTVDINKMIQAFRGNLAQVPAVVVRAWQGLQHFFSNDLPNAIQKAIDVVQAAGGDLSKLPQAITDQILKSVPDIPKLLGDTGLDAGQALGQGLVQGAKPLIESLRTMLAQLRQAPVQAALEDTQAAIERDQLLLQIRGGLVPPEARAQARREIRDLSRNVLPIQQLAAFDVRRDVTLAQRDENLANLQYQIGQTSLAIAQQAAPTVQIPLTVNITHDDGQTEVFKQLIEANSQAQQPPIIQVSGVRR